MFKKKHKEKTQYDIIQDFKGALSDYKKEITSLDKTQKEQLE